MMLIATNTLTGTLLLDAQKNAPLFAKRGETGIMEAAPWD
jgi:hypothetical protein